jgi:hypothetical protein
MDRITVRLKSDCCPKCVGIRTEELVKINEALLAEVLDALSHRGQPGPELGKKGRGHSTVYILCVLTARIKCLA